MNVMRDGVGDMLKDILARHGRDTLVDDQKRCRSVLKENFPQSRREVAALIAALDEGVPKKLLNMPVAALTPTMAGNLADQIFENTGVNCDIARWAVETWADGLDLKIRAAAPDEKSVENIAAPQKLIDGGGSAKPAASRRITRRVLIAGGIITAGAGAATFWWLNPQDRPPTLMSKDPLLRTTNVSGVVDALAIVPDGRTAISAKHPVIRLDRASGQNEAPPSLSLSDFATGNELRSFECCSYYDKVNAIAITPDGRTGVTAGSDKSLKLWDLASGTLLRGLTDHTEAVNAVAVAPDGRTALSGSQDHTLKLWDLISGNVLRTFKGHNDAVWSVFIAQDGRTALSGSADNTLKLWDLGSGNVLGTFAGHTGKVFAVAFAPGGRVALSGSEDKSLKLWDLATGAVLRTFTGHEGPVRAIAIAPDGRTAVSASQDHTLKLWHLPTGALLQTLSGHSSWVFTVAITPDGRRALSGGLDETVRLWDIT